MRYFYIKNIDKWFKAISVFIALLIIWGLSPNHAFSQCSNFNSQWPAATQSTTSSSLVQINTCMFGGNYAVCEVTNGETYVWTTCFEDAYDTQLSLWNSAQTINYAYNDDDCGAQSTITWTATFTGTVHVLVSEWSCSDNTTCTTLEWACTSCGGGSEMTVPANTNNSYTTCSGTLYDSGGSTGDYGLNQNGYTVLYPDVAGNVIQVSGNLDSEGSFDYLYIYNGVGTGGTLLWSGSGNQVIPTLTSTDATGALTIQFTTDGSVVYPGFSLNISCTTTGAEMIVPTTGNNSYTTCSEHCTIREDRPVITD